MANRKSFQQKRRRYLSTFRPRFEQLEQRVTLHGASIEFATLDGFRSLGGAVIESTTPVVRITIPDEHLGKQVRVFLDDLDKSTERIDITDQFPSLHLVGVESAQLDLGPGAHSIEVRAGRHTAQASMLNFDQGVVAVTSPVFRGFEKSATSDSRLEKHTLLLDFFDETPLNTLSDYLGQQEFAPLDISIPMRVVRIEIPNDVDPEALARELNSQDDAYLDNAVANYEVQLFSIDVAGESIPKRINDTYTSADGGFAHSELNGTTNEVQQARQHFLMNTYAGHRLVEVLTSTAAIKSPVTVAVIDTGFGKGGENPTDIPDDAIVKPTNIDRVVSLSEIGDGAPGKGHGTAVAVAIAGRGTKNLGTGAHLNVRPMRIDGKVVDETVRPTLSTVVSSLQVAAVDDSVQVINTSLGSSAPEAAQLFKNVASTLLKNGKIWVAALGNSGTNANLPYPAVLAPGDAPRQKGDNLIMAVSATETMTDISGPEMLTKKSNFGTSASVSALGHEVFLQNKDGVVDSFNGTSFAAPLVAGLAGEMIYMDRNMGSTEKLTPLQIIELIEATADDLGSTVLETNKSKPNDNPNKGFDPAFGHGRINVWKSLLGVANRGIATTKTNQKSDNEFPSLAVISEAASSWYGFEIRTSQLGATVWIDGEQLTDGGATMPNTPNITAYAGVQPHVEKVKTDSVKFIADRGSMPVGTTRGEYVTRFSIRATDLQGGVRQRTLSLRLPGQSVADAAFFNLPLDVSAMRAGEIPGVTFDDFVFEVTPSDFGDAPDTLSETQDAAEKPGFPTMLTYSGTSLLENGARHLNSNYEWLGTDNNLLGVTAESNANSASDPDGVSNSRRTDTQVIADLDRGDDGVIFYPITYRAGSREGIMDFTVSVARRQFDNRLDADEDRYQNLDGNARLLYVNAWIDWNGNQVFEEANNEHVVDGLAIHPNITAKGGFGIIENAKTKRLSHTANSTTFRSTFSVGTISGDIINARVRLDYAENAGRNDPWPLFLKNPTLRLATGPAQYGEVEDYQISVDFGDAQDPFAGVVGKYPTKRNAKIAMDGARHLDATKEWLGDMVTREFDTHGATAGDADSAPNLGIDGKSGNLDSGDDSRAEYSVLDRKLTVAYKVTSSIATHGFSSASTPASSKNKGRYDKSDSAKRIYLNIWADLNGNGSWEDAGENILTNHPVDPADFGPNGEYTLGENFEDNNKNGVFEPGIDSFNTENDDVAGKSFLASSITYVVPADVTVASKFYVRLRLTYGEPASGEVSLPGAYSQEEKRNLEGPRGAALYGEVEDIIPTFTGSIRGQVWQDYMDNGVHDLPLEPGMNGWTITLFRKEGDAEWEPIRSMPTVPMDINNSGTIEAATEFGVYEFKGLATGAYMVVVGNSIPLWSQTFPNATTHGALMLPPILHETYMPFGHFIVLGSGESIIGKDFGNAPPKSLSTPSAITLSSWTPPSSGTTASLTGSNSNEPDSKVEWSGVRMDLPIAGSVSLSSGVPILDRSLKSEEVDGGLVDELSETISLLALDSLRNDKLIRL